MPTKFTASINKLLYFRTARIAKFEIITAHAIICFFLSSLFSNKIVPKYTLVVLYSIYKTVLGLEFIKKKIKLENRRTIHLFFPFKLQYIPVSDIDSVSVSVDYELGHKKDRAYASRINIVMQIKGKRYKIPIAIGASKYMIIRMAGNGKLILEEAEKFADILLNVKEEKRKARLLQETGKYD